MRATATRRRFWLQQNGASVHTAVRLREWLGGKFGDRVISKLSGACCESWGKVRFLDGIWVYFATVIMKHIVGASIGTSKSKTGTYSVPKQPEPTGSGCFDLILIGIQHNLSKCITHYCMY